MKPRVLLFGAGGQVGRQLVMRAHRHGVTIEPRVRADVDLADSGVLYRTVVESGCDIVVNAAAWTDVDGAEQAPGPTSTVNAEAPGIMARAASSRGMPLIHISTDYVFSGDSERPYVEGDVLSPLNTYGRTKATGEARVATGVAEHLILRTASVFSSHGKNFVTQMARLLLSRNEVGVVEDQTSCPTPASSLADAILSLAVKAVRDREVRWGVYHLAGSPPVTWYDFAREIRTELLKEVRSVGGVVPVSSDAFPRPARRPQYSVLDSSLVSREFGLDLVLWRPALASVIESILGTAD